MKPIIRKACFVLAAALCAVAFTACEDDDTAGGDLQLYYSTVVDIGPSMNYRSGAPSYYGPTPSEFVIDRVTCDDQPVEVACFSIDAANGAVSIADTGELPTGTYKLSISCRAGGGTFRFSDIFVVRMVAAAPAELELSTPMLDIPYAELATTEASVTVTPVGETVSILSYALQQEEGREYFAISNKEGKGVVTLNPDFKGEVLPGTYPLPICITTRAGKYTYENLLTVRITSAPLEIEYPAPSGRMEQNRPFTSQGAPTVKGSPEQLVWAIEKITPSDGVEATDKIVIDPATGVISVAENSGLPVDAVYMLDLRVSNEFGDKVFEGAYTLTVIAYIEPLDPATFGYDKVEVIQGGAFSVSPKAGLVGDELKFELGELPAELDGKIEINPASGAISSVGNLSVALGEYAIPVKVENIKSSAETTLTLSVIENPYYFTKIVYGNNLGLEPAENYANQYRCASAGDMTALSLVPTTDAKPGTQLKWTIAIKHQCGGTVIDSDTGELSMSGFKAKQGGLIFVTATAGEGQAGETSVTVPVFFYFYQAVDGVSVLYEPFVFQVNPRTGGRSATPTIEGADPSQFSLDYRRTFNYYNLNGPDTHINGQPSADGFLRNYVWQPYYEAISDPDPAGMAVKGNRAPVSYYDNKDRLSVPAAYVDPATFEVVVNPNKWIDTNGNAASGMFHGQMTFITTGKNTDPASSKLQVFPIWIWFDENF